MCQLKKNNNINNTVTCGVTMKIIFNKILIVHTYLTRTILMRNINFNVQSKNVTIAFGEK
jgi:hypothetical protein